MCRIVQPQTSAVPRVKHWLIKHSNVLTKRRKELKELLLQTQRISWEKVFLKYKYMAEILRKCECMGKLKKKVKGEKKEQKKRKEIFTKKRRGGRERQREREIPYKGK